MTDTDKKIVKWIKELDKTLEKRSVAELIKFMEKWEKEKLYDNSYVERFKKASPRDQLFALCKTIYFSTDISRETKEWALETLLAIMSSKELLNSLFESSTLKKELLNKVEMVIRDLFDNIKLDDELMARVSEETYNFVKDYKKE
jgi:hypothetical protein